MCRSQRFPASCPRLLPSRGLGALPWGVSTAGRQSELWGSARSWSCFLFFPTALRFSTASSHGVPGSRVSLVTQLRQRLLRKSGATWGVGGTLSPGPDSPCLLSKRGTQSSCGGEQTKLATNRALEGNMHSLPSPTETRLRRRTGKSCFVCRQTSPSFL